MKITKQRLKEIIKEELHNEARPATERPGYKDEPNTFEMSVDELGVLGKQGLRKIDDGLKDLSSAIARLMEQHDAGELVHIKTKVSQLYGLLDLLEEDFDINLGKFVARKARK